MAAHASASRVDSIAAPTESFPHATQRVCGQSNLVYLAGNCAIAWSEGQLR